jgi:hypothetical protein
MPADSSPFNVASNDDVTSALQTELMMVPQGSVGAANNSNSTQFHNSETLQSYQQFPKASIVMIETATRAARSVLNAAGNYAASHHGASQDLDITAVFILLLVIFLLLMCFFAFMNEEYGHEARSKSPMSAPSLLLANGQRYRKPQICDPSLWQHLVPLYCVHANQIFDVVEPGSWGNLDIFPYFQMQGPPIFVAAVMPFGSSPRALLMTAANERSRALCSCAPSSGGTGPCSELELHDSEGRLWGSLALSGQNYVVFLRQIGTERATEPAFRIEGDNQSGKLFVKDRDGEVIAHSGIDDRGTQLEVGVAPETDPILMLTFVIAVLVFNPAGPPFVTPRSKSEPHRLQFLSGR